MTTATTRNPFVGKRSQDALRAIRHAATVSAYKASMAGSRHARSLEDHRQAYEVSSAYHHIAAHCERVAAGLVTVSALTDLRAHFLAEQTARAEGTHEGHEPSDIAARAIADAANLVAQVIAARAL